MFLCLPELVPWFKHCGAFVPILILLHIMFCFLSNKRDDDDDDDDDEWTNVVSGTPEGSILSPLLFALYVNDLPEKIQTKCLLFADDVNLYHTILTQNDSLLL